MTVEWHSTKVSAAANKVCGDIESKIADMVFKSAKSGVKKVTGKLASEIEIKKSKFKNGGYIIQAQGPGNYTKYYAKFLEFGTHKMKAQPYMRPAVKKHERQGHQMLKQAIL